MKLYTTDCVFNLFYYLMWKRSQHCPYLLLNDCSLTFCNRYVDHFTSFTYCTSGKLPQYSDIFHDTHHFFCNSLSSIWNPLICLNGTQVWLQKDFPPHNYKIMSNCHIPFFNTCRNECFSFHGLTIYYDYFIVDNWSSICINKM